MADSSSNKLTVDQLSKLATAEWQLRLGKLVTSCGSDSFCKCLIDTIHWLVPVDQVVIIAYHPESAPLFLFDNVKSGHRKAVISSYTAGAYLLDPWLEITKQGLPDGTYRLADIAPDNFFFSDFYRIYYHDTHLKDEVDYVLTQSNGVVVEISLGRIMQQFDAEDINLLKHVEPVFLSLCRQSWSQEDWLGLIGKDDLELTETHRQVVNVLNNFGSSLLTERERQVAVLMLRGHSLKSVADTLDIAMGTSKVHCKNLYFKLGIGSLSELFSLFIDVLTCKESINADDPLQVYLKSSGK